jgi:hypothetical protein
MVSNMDAGFRCDANDGDFQPTMPTCPGGTLQARVVFPDCWDGVNLNKLDQSHMRASENGRCFESHPVAVPLLRVFVRWDSDGGPDARFSSGDASTFHMDFWNAWHPITQFKLVYKCIRNAPPDMKCVVLRDVDSQD